MCPTRLRDVWQTPLSGLTGRLKGFFRKACHHYPDIPTPRVLSYNHGHGGWSCRSPGSPRYAQGVANMMAFMKRADIIQDGQDSEQRWAAGTCVWIKNTFLQNFEITEEIIEQGYVQSITLTPKGEVDIRTPVFTQPF